MTSPSASPATPAEPYVGSPAPAASTEAVPGPPAAPPPRPHRVRRTRISGAWTAAALFAVVLLLLLIFILENGQKVSVTFFGATAHLPLGVALLLSAVLGILLLVIPGTARIVQLRITARRNRKSDLAAAAADSPPVAAPPVAAPPDAVPPVAVPPAAAPPDAVRPAGP